MTSIKETVLVLAYSFKEFNEIVSEFSKYRCIYVYDYQRLLGVKHGTKLFVTPKATERSDYQHIMKEAELRGFKVICSRKVSDEH